MSSPRPSQASAADWQEVALGDIAEVTSGGRAPQEAAYFGGAHPFVRVKHLAEDREIVDDWDEITDEAVADHNLRRFPQGTIVFPKSGASIRLEKRGRLSADAYLVSHLCAVLPDPEAVDPDYLFRVLQTIRFADRKSDGYPTLKISEIRAKRLRLPPLDEQREIGQILRQMSEARTNAERVTRAAKSVRAALLAHLFTNGPVPPADADPDSLQDAKCGRIPQHWEVVGLSEVVEIRSGQVDPREEPYAQMIHVGPDNIESATGKLSAGQTAAALGLVSGKYPFSPEDVLYSKIRPYLVKAALPTFAGICSADMYPLRPKSDRLDRVFLLYCLLSPGFTKQAISFQTRTGIPKINREQLGRVFLPLPPVGEQKQIGELMAAADAKLRAAERREDVLRRLSAITMSDLVSGSRRLQSLEAPSG